MREMENINQTNQPPPTNLPKKNLGLIAGVAFLVIASFLIGKSSAQTVSQNDATSADYSLLWQTIKLVKDKYVDKPIDEKKMMYGAVKGAVQSLGDPHSVFLDPAENKRFRSDLAGNFDGIGAEIATKDGNLTVVAPLKGSPAERAGIRPLDLIVKIDGQESLDMPVEEAVTRIRGPKGTQVKLTIMHKGEEATVDIIITRENIKIESVKSELKTVNGKKIAYINLTRFGPDAKQAFTEAVNKLVKPDTSGIILDLRNDPGGLLDGAIDIGSFWLKQDQVVLKEVDAQKNESLYYSRGPGQLAKYKTVVLINGGSASASEIVAGALQDYKLATLVGEKSFGKGSVQDLVDMAGGSALKITIAKWLTPNGKSINKQGIEPDIKVEMKPDDYKNQKDPQLDRALEMFK